MSNLRYENICEIINSMHSNEKKMFDKVELVNILKKNKQKFNYYELELLEKLDREEIVTSDLTEKLNDTFCSKDYDNLPLRIMWHAAKDRFEIKTLAEYRLLKQGSEYLIAYEIREKENEIARRMDGYIESMEKFRVAFDFFLNGVKEDRKSIKVIEHKKDLFS